MKRTAALFPLILLFLFSCTRPSGTTVKYSPFVDSILQDTSTMPVRARQVREQLLVAPNDSAAIAGLSAFTEFYFGNAAVQLADETFRLSRKPGNSSGMAHAWCARGVAAHRTQQYDTALYFLDQSVTAAKKLNDPQTALRATIWKGDCYRMTYRIPEAQRVLDSCAKIAEESKWPFLEAQSLSLAGDVYRFNNLDSVALMRYEKAITVARSCGDSARIAFSLASMAQVYRKHSEPEKAMKALERGLVAARAANDLSRAAFILSTLGDEYRFRGELPKALDCYNEAVAYAKKNHENRRIGVVQNVVTQVYWSQGDLVKSFAANTEALQAFTAIKDPSSLAYALCNRGEIYRIKKQPDSALYYYRKGMEVSSSIGETQRLGYACTSMADIFHDLGNMDSAYVYAEKAIAYGHELNEDNLLSDAIRVEAMVELDRGNLALAKKRGEESLEVAKRSETEANITSSYELLYLVNKRLGNDHEALAMLEAFRVGQDSLKGNEQVRKMAAVEYKAREQELKAEQAQREAKITTEKKHKEEELARQRIITGAASIGGLLLLVLLIVAFNAYRNKRQANKVIEQQKSEVELQKTLLEEKNREVHDSITYAKRLQQAILPEPARIRASLPSSFIYYEPKDIVAGDFYWFEKIGERIFIAAADCTGHGVPGALVSVVCSNALNKAVLELKLTDPGKILDAVTDIVLETFARGGNTVSDGMDISLAVIDTVTKNVQWAGANRPLWIAGSEGLSEIKGDRQPVGKSELKLPFTTHAFSGEGKTIYLFSDGFADQFGGDEGKKFQVKNFRKWISVHANLEPDEQLARLNKMFSEWRGNREQVDDVCVIGIRV